MRRTRQVRISTKKRAKKFIINFFLMNNKALADVIITKSFKNSLKLLRIKISNFKSVLPGSKIIYSKIYEIQWFQSFNLQYKFISMLIPLIAPWHQNSKNLIWEGRKLKIFRIFIYNNVCDEMYNKKLTCSQECSYHSTPVRYPKQLISSTCTWNSEHESNIQLLNNFCYSSAPLDSFYTLKRPDDFIEHRLLVLGRSLERFLWTLHARKENSH